MQIEGRAKSHPKINAKHDWQVGKVKASPDTRDPEGLQKDEDRENSDIEFFVLEHSGGEQTAAARRKELAVSSRSGSKASDLYPISC